MNTIKAIRNQLGINQLQLAMYLQISPAMLGHCEMGIRSLPTAALIKLSNLELLKIAAQKETAPEAALSAAQQQVFNKEVGTQIRKIKSRLALYNKQLAALKTTYATAVLKAALPAVQPQQAIAFTSKDTLWLSSLQIIAVKDINDAHPGKHALLEIKIAALSQQLTALSKLL